MTYGITNYVMQDNTNNDTPLSADITVMFCAN